MQLILHWKRRYNAEKYWTLKKPEAIYIKKFVLNIDYITRNTVNCMFYNF